MRITRALIVAAAAVWLIALPVMAQNNDPKGLDALSDDRLLNELARRNLRPLLDHAFEKSNTPPEKRNAVLAGAALMRLQSDQNISLNDKRKLVAEYVKALPQLLPLMTDPASLLGDANILIEHGILTDQRLLEYFGPNSTIMSRLHPVTDAAQDMLARARDQAGLVADKAANNWPAGKPAWERADQQQVIAEYTRNIINYSGAISLDKADLEREKRLVEGLEYLSTFDNDENPSRADVKFYIAKLNMARGTKESLQTARQGFAYVIEKGDAGNLGQQFDARFLTIVTEINARNAPAAQAALGTLDQWSKQRKLEGSEVAVALAAMKYRITLLQAELAGSPAEKEKLATSADGVLDQLQQSQPALRGLILELMAANVKPDAPIKELNNLLLQSLRAKAEAETIKPEGVSFDKPAVERGLDAAREIIRRDGKENQQVVNDCLYVSGFFLQKLDQREAAAAAFLDFVDRLKNTDKDRATVAFNNAIALVGDLYRQKKGDAEVTRLYDRVLAIAVDKPFERMEFAFERARRLQSSGKVDQAIAMFDKIPENDKQSIEARYFKMVAVNQKLDTLKSSDPQRPALLSQLQQLADQVTGSFDKQLAGADDLTKKIVKTRLSQTRLLAAKIALRDQADPKRAVALLADFEKTVKGLPGEQDLLGEVLLIRVQSFMQSGQVNEATGELVRLAEQRPAETGQIVFNLLQKLDEQVIAAEAAGNDEQVAQLERNRASLTPFYVQWIKNSSNDELKKYAYSAAVFDADTQRRAAELTQDASRRADLLKAALKRFEELDTAEQFQQFLAIQPPEKRSKLKYDPQVKMGLARSYFAMGDWEKSRLPLARLFADKILGEGTMFRANAAGGVDEMDNPTYWEALYRLIKCNVELKDNVEGMKRWLTSQYSVYGNDLGGQRWSKELKTLARDLEISPPATTAPSAG